MRRIALVLALCLGSAPAFAADPVPAPDPTPTPIVIPASERASDADIDRLFEAMDTQSMMDGMVRQMFSAQQAMIVESFGKDLSAEDRKRVDDMFVKAKAITLEHLSWAAMEPIMHKLYAQVYSKQEVDAMIGFYSTPEGVSILKKMPQATVLTLQAMQPIARDVMADVKAMVDEELAATKSKRPRP